MKTCTKCGKHKPLSEFYALKTRPHSWCCECVCEYQRKYQRNYDRPRTHPETIPDKVIEWDNRAGFVRYVAIHLVRHAAGLEDTMHLMGLDNWIRYAMRDFASNLTTMDTLAGYAQEVATIRREAQAYADKHYHELSQYGG